MNKEEGWEIDTCTEMRRVMRKRYAPTSYSRTTRQKLQRLSQGSLIVEEYYKEMEMALVRMLGMSGMACWFERMKRF